MNTIKISWHREPWVWFILLLLGSACSFAVYMTYVAIKNTPAEIGSEWYQKSTLSLRERKQEALVSAVALQADMTITTDGKIELRLTHQKQANDKQMAQLGRNSLMLYVEHAFDPAQDFKLELKRETNGVYTAQLPSHPQGKNRLLLSPADNQWFLAGVAAFPVKNIVLSPEMS